MRRHDVFIAQGHLGFEVERQSQLCQLSAVVAQSVASQQTLLFAPNGQLTPDAGCRLRDLECRFVISAVRRIKTLVGHQGGAIGCKRGGLSNPLRAPVQRLGFLRFALVADAERQIHQCPSDGGVIG